MKTSITILSILLILFSQDFSKPKKLDIYLLIGQSNMAGRGMMTAADTIALQNVYLFNDKNEWEFAKHPLNRYSTVRKDLKLQGINLGYEFGKMVSEKVNVKIGLVVNARGGSSIREWHKDSLLYVEALKRAKIAQKSGTLKAIIWHQGSSDRALKEKYLSKLKDMVIAFRKDLGMPNLPIIVGQLGSWRESFGPFNQMMTHVSDSIPYSDWVSTEGLIPNEGDSLHFNAESLNMLGKRYAEKVLKNVYGISE